MFASVVTGQGSPDMGAQAGEYYKNLPAQKGQIRGYMVIDRKTGKWMTFNLWETEEDARGYESTGSFQKDLQEAQRMGASNVTREVFEVLIEK